jgi:hypothetical protein
MILLEQYDHEDVKGEFGEMIATVDYSDCLRIFVWRAPADPLANTIAEVTGNKTIHLTGQYYFRYDPPRTASSGADAVPKGDWHLFDKSGEIAAWDSTSKARHGFPAGTKIPNRAYDELMRRYPDCCGLTGKVLEQIEFQRGAHGIVQLLSENER